MSSLEVSATTRPAIGPAAALLWFLGTLGRAAVFGLCVTAVEGWDNWSTVTTDGEGGASMIFVVVAPAEAALAAVWAAVDAWRRAGWTSLLVRWGLVGLVAGLGLVLADMFAWSAGPQAWYEVATKVAFQVVSVGCGAAAGAGIMKAALILAAQGPSRTHR